MIRPLEKGTYYTEIIAQLKKEIANGTWKLGERLPGELTLAKQFNVSRSSIREALKALAYAGIVESKPGRGTFLLHVLDAPEADDFDDSAYAKLIEVRKLIEGQAAYWCVQRATPQQIQQLEAILREGEEDGDAALNVAHMKFHAAIARLADNPYLTRMIDSLNGEIKRQKEVNFKMLPREDRKEHWKVLEAIKSGDPSLARRVMVKHVEVFWKKGYKHAPATEEPQEQ
ncbi:MAG: FadR/GntR family transcriptional regulator [Pyramidobacter sp.]|uniref:FadR/GntR family transcriptional regulator n=1 Tax=Pyramidobacter sp. TaxID=1943581 RepID=UPI002A81A144|nr:FadR/GntR family transcriptional regulator [Pyramidobacter sp.]MDY4033093.1 FadR/GntR family transcriptional regulator [Pyramidobacter sp.]